MRDALYHLGEDGVMYRVLDTTMRQGVLVAANPPASWATARVFRPKDGHRRLYRFSPAESREPTNEALARQLARAEYLPHQQHDPSERRAR